MKSDNRIKLRTCLMMGLSIACIAAGLSDHVFAYGTGGDISIFTTPDGSKVDVGFIMLDDTDTFPEFFDPNDSVFDNILIPRKPTALPPIPWTYGSGEPGLTALAYTLPPVKPVTIDTLDLKYWNGVGAPNFSTLAGVTAGDAPMPALTQAIGGFHAHAVFGVAGASVPDGIYLAKLSIGIETLLDSDPYYMVALIDHRLYTGNSFTDAEKADAMGELLHTYLADPLNAREPVFEGVNYKFYADAILYAESLVVPEPGTFWLVMVALASFFVRRSR